MDDDERHYCIYYGTLQYNLISGSVMKVFLRCPLHVSHFLPAADFVDARSLAAILVVSRCHDTLRFSQGVTTNDLTSRDFVDMLD